MRGWLKRLLVRYLRLWIQNLHFNLTGKLYIRLVVKKLYISWTEAEHWFAREIVYQTFQKHLGHTLAWPGNCRLNCLSKSSSSAPQKVNIGIDMSCLSYSLKSSGLVFNCTRKLHIWPTVQELYMNLSKTEHRQAQGDVYQTSRRYLCRASLGSLQYTIFVTREVLQAIFVFCIRTDISIDKKGNLFTCSSVAISYRSNYTIDQLFELICSISDIYYSS